MGPQKISNKNKRDILEIFSSSTGRRLLMSMLLIQPISARELQQILPLSIAAFGPTSIIGRAFPEISDAKKIPEVIKTLNMIKPSTSAESPDKKVFKNIFGDPDLFGAKSILKKAEDCKLVIGIPKKKGNKKQKFYFLNSDLEFTIQPNGKTKIVEDATCYPGRCPFDEFTCGLWKDLKRVRRDKKVSIRSELVTISGKKEENFTFNTDLRILINSLFKTIAWSHKHHNKLRELWDLNLKYSGMIERGRLKWSTDFFRKAIREKILIKDIYKVNTFSLCQGHLFRVPFRLAGSYHILNSFSNFRNIGTTQQSPMEILKAITKKEYVIRPSKRPFIFSSLVARFPGDVFLNYNDEINLHFVISKVLEKGKKITTIQKKNIKKNLAEQLKKKKSNNKGKNFIIVNRNIQLVGNIFSAFFSPKSIQHDFLLSLKESVWHEKLLSSYP